jgi:hypothetical protein
MKQLMPLIISITLSLSVFAESDLTKASRCNWGYKNTASIIDRNTKENLYPEGLSSWELCKLPFDNDLDHEGADWVIEALSFLEIPSNQLKPIEMITKRGQCEIGSILFQKKFLKVHDSIAIKLTAKGVCNLIPKSLLE